MVGKVELISTFTTAVCESWNVSDKYTWDNAGDLKQLSMDQPSVRIIGAIKRQFFHLVTQAFDNSNLSQEIFAIDTWSAASANWSLNKRNVAPRGKFRLVENSLKAWFPLHGKCHDHETRVDK